MLAAPGFATSTPIAKEWFVLGTELLVPVCSDAFLANSAVAARVNVSIRGFAGLGRLRRWSTSATSVALLPVPGPANTLADRVQSCCRIAAWPARLHRQCHADSPDTGPGG
jgi:hypothetical protein